MKTIRATQAVSERKIHHGMSTLYKWHRSNKYPGLLFKVEGSLMIDLDQWDSILKKAKAENIKRAKKKIDNIF